MFGALVPKTALAIRADRETNGNEIVSDVTKKFAGTFELGELARPSNALATTGQSGKSVGFSTTETEKQNDPGTVVDSYTTVSGLFKIWTGDRYTPVNREN